MDLGQPSFKELGPPAPEASSPEHQTIFLHILSPSLEVPDKLTFPAIPVTTTVGELKNKIQDAIATKPSPARQRLIYRGKALVKTTDTMKDVFGQEAVRRRAPGSLKNPDTLCTDRRSCSTQSAPSASSSTPYVALRSGQRDGFQRDKHKYSFADPSSTSGRCQPGTAATSHTKPRRQ